MPTDYKDFNKVVDVLLENDVFEKMDGKRQHSQFKFSHTLFVQGDKDKFVKWMEKTLGQMMMVMMMMQQLQE